jgi:hypothetical protein
MDGRSVIVDELQSRSDSVKAPFDGLIAQTFPLDVPAERSNLLCYNVDVAFRLNYFNDFDNARMAQCAQLASSVSGHGQPWLVEGNIESKDAARGPVFLPRIISHGPSSNEAATYSFRGIV